MLGHVVWRAILNPELMGSISDAVFKVGHRVLSFLSGRSGWLADPLNKRRQQPVDCCRELSDR